MSVLRRLTCRPPLMTPAARRFPPRPPMTLDFVEFMEGVASRELGQSVRQMYDKQQADIRKAAAKTVTRSRT